MGSNVVFVGEPVDARPVLGFADVVELPNKSFGDALVAVVFVGEEVLHVAGRFDEAGGWVEDIVEEAF